MQRRSYGRVQIDFHGRWIQRCTSVFPGEDKGRCCWLSTGVWFKTYW